MNIEKLKELIEYDKTRTTGSYNRYPVRFVFAELNEKTQDEIINLINAEKDNFVDLKDTLLKKDEGWITKGSFMNKVKSCPSDRDTYIVGFSELIRFYSNKELEAILLSLVNDIENTPIERKKARRIYIVCFSMKEYIQKILGEKYHKFDLFNPCINEELEYSEGVRDVYFLNDKLKLPENFSNVVDSAGEWLNLWRRSAIIDFSKPMVTKSKILYSWYEKASPDNTIQTEVIHTYADMINALCDIKIPLLYSEKESVFWQELFEYIEDNKTISSFNELVRKAANIDNVDIYTLIVKWIDEDDSFIKWLISKYIMLENNDSLLSEIFSTKNPTTKEKLVEALWLRGYEDNVGQRYEERRAIIFETYKYIKHYIPETQIKEKIENLLNTTIFENSCLINILDFDLKSIASQNSFDEDIIFRRLKELYESKLKYALIGKCAVEKEFIINLFRNGVISRDEIKEKYPAFYSYLSADNGVEETELVWINEYFKEYRESKVLCKDSDRLSELLGIYNNSSSSFYDWYYQLKNQESIIKSMQMGVNVYVLDGVGAEYMPFIISILKSRQYHSREYTYAASHLPSITDVNKPYLANYIWYRDFDRDVIHGAYYRLGESLRKALDSLEKIIDEIIRNENGNPFIITADHGATARSKWTKPGKMYSFSDADHEGRCCKVAEDVEANSYYISYNGSDQKDKWAVALKDVSLNNSPKYEGHGGATPEEVIVPVILATYKMSDNTINYRVEGKKTSVTGLDKKVEFTINPNPSSVLLVEENGTEVNLINEVENIWGVELSTGMQQNVKIYVDEQQFDIRITSTRSKIMEDDDGFDD